MAKLDLRVTQRMKVSLGEINRLKGSGFAWSPPSLRAFYGIGSGRIDLHLAARTVEKDTPTTFRGYKNLGGAGSLYDFDFVTPSSPSKPYANNIGTFNSDTNHLYSANPISLLNSRILFAGIFGTTANNDGIVGGVDCSIKFGSFQTNRSVYVSTETRESGIRVTRTPTPRFTPSQTAVGIIEVDIGLAGITVYQNGAQVSTLAANITEPFNIDRLASGWQCASAAYQLGDLIRINHGEGFDAALAAARAYLNSLYGIGVA